jgi:hypothetical protein
MRTAGDCLALRVARSLLRLSHGRDRRIFVEEFNAGGFMAERRRTSGTTGTPKGRGSSNIGITGEKKVRPTASTVPVKRSKREDVNELPTDPAAIDHRRQIVGLNDTRSARPPRK